MSVYIDPLMNCLMNKHWHWKESCHLIADSEAELHKVASMIGLKKEYFQKKGDKIPHYDLTSSKRILAIKVGAIPITTKEFVFKMRKYRQDWIKQNRKKGAKKNDSKTRRVAKTTRNSVRRSKSKRNH